MHKWGNSFSLSQNTISDLGNTVCGAYDSRMVCSPLHDMMNVSFIILGLTMLGGSLLLYQQCQKSSASFIGFSMMSISAVGTIMVGLFPENGNAAGHALGAGLPFVLGNLGLVVLGLYLDMPRLLRFFTIIPGLIALLALALFSNYMHLGLGIGGIERLIAYPQTLWLIVFGSHTMIKDETFTKINKYGIKSL